MGKNDRKKLLFEAHQTNYSLRSAFFNRKIREFGIDDLAEEVLLLNTQFEDSLKENYKEYNISDTALEHAVKNGIILTRLFSTPKLLQENPQLITYYRSVACLSQKSVQHLGNPHPKAYEVGLNKNNLSMDTATGYSRLFNKHISLIIDSDQEFNEENIDLLLLTSLGAQIDGSWRNAIGDEAEILFYSIILKDFLEEDLIRGYVTSDEKIVPIDMHVTGGDFHGANKTYKGFVTVNNNRVIFSSEPDVSLYVGESLNGVIEIKGGTDPAGALERYGAAKKSFGESRMSNKDCFTMLVANCITEEVESRINNDPLFNESYNLTEIVSNDTIREEILIKIKGVLGLTVI